MEIITSAKELMNVGKWLKFCEVTGINEWAVNEGLIDENDSLALSPVQFKKIFLEEEF